MDQLEGAMTNLTVKTVAMPAKRSPGQRGVKSEFLTNLTKLTLKPNVPFFKYDVRMYMVYKGKDGGEHLKELTKQTKDDFPEQERKASSVIVYKHLVKSYPDVFTKGGALFYDRAAILFSAQVQLKFDGEKKEFHLPASVLSNAGDNVGVRVVIKKVADSFQVTSNDILKAVNVRDIERDRSILEVLNLAISQEGYLETLKFVAYGSTVQYLFDHQAFGFRDNELPELMDGKYAGIGLSKSVKVLEGDDGKCSPFVVADVTKSAFHADEQNLLEKISQMSIFFDYRTGLYVKTLYGRTRTFPIGGISAAASSLRFQATDGKQYTVEQYYLKQYNIQLKYPGLFTVSERHNPHTYYPVELLAVAPSQRVTQQQQTPSDVMALIKASATLPQQRLSQTRVMKNALKIAPGNSLLEAAGISVDKNFTKVVGRVLPSPTILYGGSSIAKVDEWYAEQKKKNRKYLLFITSDNIQQHDTIKLLEVQYQIVSQEVKAGTVTAVVLKNQNQTLDNVISKINQKLGGVNYNIVLDSRLSEKNWLSDNGVLFVGFEISNPPALSKMEIARGETYKMPSVLGWGANCSSNPQQYLGDYVYVEPRQSDMMGSKLADIVIDIIKRHQMATSVTLQHIIFYFSGISEGQFSMVGWNLVLSPERSPAFLWFKIADMYMRAVYTAISCISLENEPKVTALAVSKDHNERIYKSNIVGKRAAEQNIPGGTVIDTTIVSPVINEFYLNAHSAFQGTAKTPKYSLVADNSQISLDAIEGVTYGLCYLHEIVTATVSLPVPLVVADRCAKRGHDVYVANLREKHVVVNSIKEANELLVNQGGLKKLRYNA
ncbi:hypothetical protein Angca_007488 [Angiostrongylus cantonensis]|nr:hypothetical protein Angca_007488 [Angiostrongylus cantonensis]